MYDNELTGKVSNFLSYLYHSILSFFIFRQPYFIRINIKVSVAMMVLDNLKHSFHTACVQYQAIKESLGYAEEDSDIKRADENGIQEDDEKVQLSLLLNSYRTEMQRMQNEIEVILGRGVDTDDRSNSSINIISTGASGLEFNNVSSSPKVQQQQQHQHKTLSLKPATNVEQSLDVYSDRLLQMFQQKLRASNTYK